MQNNIINESNIRELSGQQDFIENNSFAYSQKKYLIYSQTAHSYDNRVTSACRLKNIGKYFDDIPIEQIKANTILNYQLRRLIDNSKAIKPQA